MGDVPETRIRAVNTAPVARDRPFVLYWMIAARRTTWNFGLERAVSWAARLQKPLVVLEALRCDYPWASDRLHRFVLAGMRDNAARLHTAGVTHHAYVEPAQGAGRGLLAALAARACVVVTDEFPCYFLPQMVAAAAARLDVPLEAVDSNGLLPLRVTEQVFSTAHSFRRFVQKHLREHLAAQPVADPLKERVLPSAAALPADILKRWPKAPLAQLLDEPAGLAGLPIDHTVGAAPFSGGAAAATAALERFLERHLEHYLDLRNVPDEDAASGLSPYLHFGHISAHEVFWRLMRRERWSEANLAERASGSRAGWWGTSPNAEAFLDQLVTWRELGYQFAARRGDHAQYASLPDWARATLAKHAGDRREHVYSLDEFAAGATHDRLWNAAANQLRTEGRLHNYLRMLWGKKILEWSDSPEQALETMIALNDRYAVDGRDPNSYSGIGWVLGRFDRPWGPERPIFGTVRYMSSANTARKLAVQKYLERYAP
ncbi:MAG: deoxyribodipyrimidine photolyase [Pirellulales bacterium]